MNRKSGYVQSGGDAAVWASDACFAGGAGGFGASTSEITCSRGSFWRSTVEFASSFPPALQPQRLKHVNLPRTAIQSAHLEAAW